MANDVNIAARAMIACPMRGSSAGSAGFNLPRSEKWLGGGVRIIAGTQKIKIVSQTQRE